MANRVFGFLGGRKPRKNIFDLSHERKMSVQFGKLVPTFLLDVIPGDRVKMGTELLARLAPTLAPVMHRINITVHFFFVPNRLVWDNWENFITGGEDGNFTATLPGVQMDNNNKAQFTKGTLADYFGLPVMDEAVTVTTEGATPVSALPFRAYQTIYNEYYRDQNLESPIDFSTGNDLGGKPQTRLTTMRNRAWEKDYFTSCLPSAQKGPGVTLPVTSTFQPQYISNGVLDGNPTSGANLITDPAGGGHIRVQGDGATPYVLRNLAAEQNVTHEIPINDLRTAHRLQKWLETNMRAGSRYIESILAHFGVVSPDARLQRPEYLGGIKKPIVFSEVLNTTGSVDAQVNQPLGSFGGHGLSVGGSKAFDRRFTEHGIIMGIMSILPRTAYQEGIHRNWLKTDKLDYYWPEFANLGEQGVKNGELFWDFAESTDGDNKTKDFGYQSRHAEYRYYQDSVHGEFRDTLNFWHQGRIFKGARPNLNPSFIQADPAKRIFAVSGPNDENAYIQLYNQVRALRPIPYFARPSL